MSEHARLIPDTKWILASLGFTFNTRRQQTTLVASSLLVGRWCRRVCIGHEQILLQQNLHYLGAALSKQMQSRYYAVCYS